MIYLLQDCYKDNLGIYHDILKIGYSKDSFMDNRVNQYNTHNYGYKFLKEREGDTKLETYLHSYFSKYKLSDSTEWFEYNQEIVDNFDIIQYNEYLVSISNYIDLLRNYIISNILIKPEEIYKKHSDELIKELRELYETKYSYLPWEEDIYLQRFKNTLKDYYGILVNFWKTIDFLKETNILDLSNDQEMIDTNKNPWKNQAELYFKTLKFGKAMMREEFNKIIEEKQKKTENLLSSYNSTSEEAKRDVAENLQRMAKTFNYSNNYVVVNKLPGKILEPCLNTLVKISEQRALDMQLVDYKDRFAYCTWF